MLIRLEDASMTGPASDDDAKLRFEQILEKLQTVVQRLENGDMPLEESLAVFEDGVRLSRLGQKRLDEAEQRVEQLLESGGQVRTVPLDEGTSR